MQIDYLSILLCGVASMVLGFVWYGPFFGKKWMHIIKADPQEMREKSQAGMWKLYATAFVLALVQAYVLSYFIQLVPELSALNLAFWLWLGFLLPVVAGASMWNNDSTKISWMRFSIQTGYQIVLLVIYALILGR